MKKIIPDGAHLVPDEAVKVFEGKIFDVFQWQQEMFDGSKDTFEMLRRPDTVTAIPISNGKILTLEDTQPFTGTKMSFPGGRVDLSDRSVLEAAQKEVKEETGYEFAKWKLTNIMQPHSKLEWFVFEQRENGDFDRG